VSFQVPHKRAAPSVDNRVASSADEAGPSQPLPKLAKLSPLSPEAEKTLLRKNQRCYRCAWNHGGRPGTAHKCDPTARFRRVEGL
jgi:hypothetical protein